MINVTDEMKLIDVNGNPHMMTPTPSQSDDHHRMGLLPECLDYEHLKMFYKVHPSSVDFSLSGLWKKMFIYIC